MTKDGKSIICKTDNFVLLVVPGLSTIPESSSSSTTPPQESLGSDAHLVFGNRAASSSSFDSVFERSDEVATRRLGQGSPRDDKKDADNPLSGLPFWLEDFTDNLEPTDVHAPAHTSQDTDSETPSKVVTKSRTHSIFAHFPKDRNCDVCLRTKSTRAPRTDKSLLQKTHWNSRAQSGNFGDLVTRTTNSSMRDLGTITGTLSWCKILQLSGFNLIRAKQNLHMRRKKVY